MMFLAASLVSCQFGPGQPFSHLFPPVKPPPESLYQYESQWVGSGGSSKIEYRWQSFVAEYGSKNIRFTLTANPSEKDWTAIQTFYGNPAYLIF